MVWFLMLIVLCALFVAALWWKPGDVRKAIATRPEPRVAEFQRMVEPVKPEPVLGWIDPRDEILEDEIEVIARLIREDERERRRKAALERLNAVQAKATATL